MMDKRSVLAIALSGIVLVTWQFIFPYTPPKTQTDSIVTQEKKEITESKVKKTPVVTTNTTELKEETNLSSVKTDKEYIITIEDDKTKRVLSSLNGVHFKNYFVKKFEDAFNPSEYVSLINENQGNQFFPTLKFNDGREYELNRINFLPVDSTLLDVQLSESNPKQTIEFVGALEGNTIYKRLTFENGYYDFNVSYDFSSLTHLLRDNVVKFSWINGMPYTEEVVYDDKNMSLMYVEGGDDFYRFDTADNEKTTITDPEYLKHITVRTKYFQSSLMPTTKDITKVEVQQEVRGKKNDIEVLNYSYTIDVNANNASFNLYVGPYDVYEMSQDRYESADLENMFFSASSYENFFSFFSRGVHLFIVWLNGFIGSFGISILLFTILIKIALFPLTKKSYQGMKAMQNLKPKMDKIKEKYGHDPRLMQEKTMAFYREEGVNPMGSCLPMFLQMPLLMALFHVFRGSIEFRGAEFLWIQNLAAPDALPLGLDSIGFATLNVLPILVAVSQIGMAKLQPAAPGADNAQQKMMQYMMPIMFLFMFYNFSAALNYYYFLFNVFTTVQQKFIHAPEKEVEVKEIKTPKGTKLNEKATVAKVQSKNKKQMYKKKDS